MNKSHKLLLRSIIICLALIMTFSFIGCDAEKEEIVGIKNATINEQGELVLTYTNGEEQNLGTVVGKDGIDGKDGINGTDGKNGIDGKDGKDGIDGINGKDGLDGTDGKNGVDGKDGINGKDGKNGLDGADGLDGSIIVNDDASTTSYAVSQGLRSSVSVFCNFSKTGSLDYGSAGSGVIYRLNKTAGSAFIITNYHVIFDAESSSPDGISQEIYLTLYGSEYSDMLIPAKYVGGSMYYDIAVLYVEESDLLKTNFPTAVHIADSDEIVVGQPAIAIGNPKGIGISASSGIVSIDSEHISMIAADNKSSVDFRVMRIDTAVNSGNSGGGLFNENGELIGIVNAKIIDDSVENIGYAIPSNVAIAVAQNIIDNCYETELTSVQRCLLGITITISNSKAVYDPDTCKIKIEEVVTVYEVSESGIAYGELKPDDIILSISINGNKRNITRQHHVIDYMLDARVGDVVVFEYSRNGRILQTNEIVITNDCVTPY